MTYHHIQYLLCVFAFFNLTSCTHQSVIKSSSAHIDQSQSSSEKNTDNPAVINLEHTTAKNDVIPIFSNEVRPIAIIYATGKNLHADGENADYETTAGVYQSDVQSASFDDMLIWISRPLLMNRMVSAGKLP